MTEPAAASTGRGKKLSGWFSRLMDSLNEGCYWLAEKIGFSTGIGIVAWGVGWLIWSAFNYLNADSETELQVLVRETYSTHALLASILIALGVLVMEVEKFRRKKQ
jgi:hypothetical protein